MKLYSNFATVFMTAMAIYGFISVANDTELNNRWLEEEISHETETTNPVKWAKIFWDWLTGYEDVILAAPSLSMASPMPIRDTLAAFPGAVGDGAMALDKCRDSVRAGAWPLKVWKITSGDETSGSSFIEIARDSLQLQPYKDTVYNIVEVQYDSATRVDNETLRYLGWNCVYFAGQTSRGEGLALWGGRVGIVSPTFADTVQDILVRFITNSTMGDFRLSGYKAYFDHITGRWSANAGGQHNFSIGADTSEGALQSRFSRHLTAAYLLSYEPRSAHPTNMHFGSSPRDVPSTSQGLLYRSVPCISIGHRCPNLQWDTATIAQVINFNWRDRAMGAANGVIANIISTYSLTGVGTAGGGIRPMPFWSGNECSGQGPQYLANGGDGNCSRQLYISKMWYHSDYFNIDDLTMADPRNDDPIRLWKTTVYGDSVLVCRITYATSYGTLNWLEAGSQCGTLGDTIPTHHRSLTFIHHTPEWSYPPDTSAMTIALVDSILDEVGNSKKLTCDGYFESRRSSLDSSRVAWLRNERDGLGGDVGLNFPGVESAWPGTVTIPGNPEVLGGAVVTKDEWTPDPNITQCTDTDDDGMPDDFETACFGDATSGNPALDLSGDGYLNIEEYLNGTNGAGRTLTWTDTSSGEDGFEIWRQRPPPFGDPPPPSLLDVVGANITTYFDATAKVGDIYLVRAYSGSNYSSFSNSDVAECR